MPKPETPKMVRIKSSSSVCFAQMNVFVFVFVVQVDPDKPRDLVVLNLDWSTREWELREYFQVGVGVLGMKYKLD